MNTATNDNRHKQKPLHGKNFPTKERMAKGEFEIYDEGRGRVVATAREKDPHKLDRLLSRGTINDEQHSYGLKFSMLYALAHPRQRTILARMMDRVTFSQFIENEILGTITGREQYNLLRGIMIGHYHPYFTLVRALCVDEMSNRAACREAGITQHDMELKAICDSFDFLGDCLQEMRQRKEYLEKTFCT